MGCPIADPQGISAVEMESGAVLFIWLSGSGAHYRGVNRNEKIAPGVRGQRIGKFSQDGTIFLSDDGSAPDSSGL